MSASEKQYCDARTAQSRAQNEKALKLFQRAAQDDHLPSLCFVAALKNGAKSATVALDALLLRAPHDGACLLLRAREAIFAGDLDDGIRFARLATQHAAQDHLTWSTLGFAYFRHQDYVDGAEAFEKSVSLEAEIHENVFNIGYAYYLGGEYERARPWLLRVLSIKDLPSQLASRAQQSIDIIDGAIWICPMHPHITGKKGDVCSLCKMDLKPASRGLGSD
jgi:Flp pilus assembly protein TadD